ncbi:MAG: hypothetical protein E3J52_06910 [Promethearchaeota archaeon]|nr:hypothetical protein [Candidatus Lokiarchaeota archaeon]TET59020.1 MAG: hypothetical protein E3J52_06910 [Candidatus Lokiarchaeota archaeon]
MSVRCRACIKCREYLVIHPSSPINQVEIKRFEKVHLGHTIMTVDINEVKGAYSSFKNHTNEKTTQEAE